MSRKIQEIDLNSIAFSKQKVNSSNKFLYVYSDKKALVLKLPATRLPFGLQKDSLSKKNQYILDFSMENSQETLQAFHKFNQAIIEKVHKDFYEGEKTLEEVTENFSNYIKSPENPKYFPTIRSKIIIDDNNVPKCDFYESEKNEDGKYPKIDVVSKGNEAFLLNVMGKNSKVESIIECIGLWFYMNKWGLSFKTTQVLIYPKEEISYPVTQDTCQFIDSESDTSNSDVDFLGE